MQKYDANSWELYHDRTFPVIPFQKGKESKKNKSYSKQQKERRNAHNDYMILTAKRFARGMRKDPSELEKRMQEFLNNKNVGYEFQKVLYLKDDNGYIQKFYIADFFLPNKNLIIETDGKFHDEQVEQDNLRTKDIRKIWGRINILRWRWNDFRSLRKMQLLMRKSV